MCSWIFFLFSVHLVVVRSRLHYRRTNPVCEFCAHNFRIFQPHTHDNNHNNNNNVKRTEAYAGFEKHRKMEESRSYIRISGRWWSYLARMHTHAWYSVCRVDACGDERWEQMANGGSVVAKKVSPTKGNWSGGCCGDDDRKNITSPDWVFIYGGGATEATISYTHMNLYNASAMRTTTHVTGYYNTMRC